MRKKKYYLLFIITSILLCGGLWLVPLTQIKASTKKMTEIDSNTSYTYELLETNQRIVEPNFIEDSNFTDYVQGETTVHNWQKKHFYSQSLPMYMATKNNLKNNIVNVVDGLVTLDYFSSELEEDNDLNVVQLNKMNFEGENVKTIYLGERSSNNYLTADKNYIPMTHEIIQNEQEQTISVLGVQEGVAKIDVFDYDLNSLYSTLIESDSEKLMTDNSTMNQFLTDFHNATITNEGNICIYPKLQEIFSEVEVTLPLLTWSPEDMNYTDQIVNLNLGKLTRPELAMDANYNITIENIYFGKNRQMLVEFSFYDLIGKQLETAYILFDKEGNYIKHLDLPNDVQNESSQFGDTIYLSSYNPASDVMTLYSFSFVDEQCTILKTYEHIQALHIYEEESERMAYGQTTKLTLDSTNLSSDSGTFIAFLDDNYYFESVLMIPNDQVEVSVKNICKLPNEIDYFINGVVIQKELNLQIMDEVNVVSEENQWESIYSEGATDLFFGTMTKIQDYAPMIKAGQTIVINKDEVDLSAIDLDANGYTVKDRLLLYGNEAGDVSESSVRAYDTYDIQQSFSPFTQEDLTKKINRNPNNLELPIDWLALGFDEDIIGPQRTLYFVTDSQNQVSTTSKVVNLIDNKTVYDNEQGNMALRVEDFVIGLQEATRLTQDRLINPENVMQYGNLLAWDLMDDTEYCYADVEVDQVELEAINYANQFGKFPLTYRLNKNGHTIQKTIVVYVLDENSEQIGDVLFYAKNSMIPWDIVKETALDELEEMILENTQAVAYDFRTGEELTDKIELNQRDMRLLSDLEPTMEMDYSLENRVVQSVQLMIDEQQLSKNIEMEVYYRFENIYVSYVDAMFNSLDVSELTHLNVPMNTIENQIVGKDFEAFDLLEEIETVIQEFVRQGYQQKGIYLADKKTTLTKDDWLIKSQHGQGNQFYVVLE